MTDFKPCIRCERPIDRYAKICVYCNWDQSALNPPPMQPAAAATTYVPPTDNRARNRILGAAGLLVAIVGAFIIGMFIHGADAKEVKPIQPEVPQVAENVPTKSRSNVTLVPVDGNDPSLTVPIEQSITSAPPSAPGQDASDATAMPSDQYAAAAAQAKALKQKEAQQQAESVDPRSLRGTAYEQTPQPAKPREETAEPQQQQSEQPQTAENNTPSSEEPEREQRTAPARTEAYPEYRPLPQIHVDQDTNARLTLTVGADGRVKEVDIVDPIPGETAQLIAAVQRWRFRPATENGTPVSARVAVTITLHGNE